MCIRECTFSMGDCPDNFRGERMTVVANSPRLITVEWRGLDADGRGGLDISELPNRLTRRHLEQVAAALLEAADHPDLPLKSFVFLF